MIEAMKQAYQLLLTEPHAPTVCDQLEVIFRRAIAELESQEPVAWVCCGSDEKHYIGFYQYDVNALPVGTMLYTHPQRTEQEPVAWGDLQKEAQQIVESKFLWKKFIDGTPLANDIACWMADFALQHTHPPQRTWVGLTDEEIEDIVEDCDGVGWDVAQAIRAKLKEKNNVAQETNS